MITDRPDRTRYVLEFDGTEAGLLTYTLEGDRIALNHAEIDPAVERRGLGSRLVSFALDDARERGLAVLPYCPFVRFYVADHRADYLDLVPESERERFGL